jgi:hypothetical protein
MGLAITKMSPNIEMTYPANGTTSGTVLLEHEATTRLAGCAFPRSRKPLSILKPPLRTLSGWNYPKEAIAVSLDSIRQELSKVRKDLERKYSDIRELGEDCAVFLVVCKDNHSVVIAVGHEDEWMIELWRSNANQTHVDDEETLVREECDLSKEEALRLLYNWLDSPAASNDPELPKLVKRH